MRNSLGEEGLISDDTRQILVVCENSRRYQATNNNCKRIIVYRIDGEMLKGCGRRCDFAIGIPLECQIFLIELKGSDLSHAASQILSTITELKPKIDSYTIRARIVLSRVPRPDIRAASVIALERKLLAYGGDFKKASSVMEEKV